MLFLDIETADDRLVCVGWAVDDEPVQSAPSFPDSVRSALANADEVVVTHSGYDVRFLHFQEGALIQAQQHDTQVMAWLANENTPLDLQYCARRYLAVELDKTLQKQAGTAPYEDVAAYCRKDVEVTRDLYRRLRELLIAEGMWDYFEVTEAPFTKTLRDVEFRGLPINLKHTSMLADIYRHKAEALKQGLTQGMPSSFNVRSPDQVSRFLASDKFIIADRLPADLNAIAGPVEVIDMDEVNGKAYDSPPGTFLVTKHGRKWDTGYWVAKGQGYLGGVNTSYGSIDKPHLLDDVGLSRLPWVTEYLEYRKYDKLLGTYLDVFPERARGGRLYGRFNQTGTATGRLSSSEPNLQNIPSRGVEGAEIRDLFKGNLVVGDFSQLEPRLMAHFSQDEAMLGAFRAGRDLYDEIAQRVKCPRGVAKTLVLAMSYGAGPEKVAQTLRLNGHAFSGPQARKLLTQLSTEFHTYFTWRESIIAQSKQNGYVTTIDGRKRRLGTKEADRAVWKDPSAPGRQAANAVVQGSAADIVRRVMLHTGRMFPELRLLAQVHDELVWEYDPATYTPDLKALERWVLQIAERGLSVPLVFEPHIGTSWYRAKEGI